MARKRTKEGERKDINFECIKQRGQVELDKDMERKKCKIKIQHRLGWEERSKGQETEAEENFQNERNIQE